MALRYLVLLIAVSVGCECSFKADTFHKEPAHADKMCHPDQVDFQAITNSAVSCVRKCSDKPGCESLIYLRGNKTCFGIKSAYPFGTSSSLPGAMFYKANSSQTTTSTTTSTTTTTMPTTTTSTTTTTPPPTTTPTPPPPTTPSTTTTTTTPTTTPTTTTATTTAPTTTTTPGPGTPLTAGLPNAQFANSSSWSANWEGWQARLNSTYYTWFPDEFKQDIYQWVQMRPWFDKGSACALNGTKITPVDFLGDILAMHLITKGRPGKDRWVTSYRVITSSDCSNFVAVKDGSGSDKEFPGNTDSDTAVQNALEPPVVCRCFRINPLAWVNFIQLRFEVLGHML